MAKVITFSRIFPKGHPRCAELTHFVEQIWNGLNHLKLPVPKNTEIPNDFLWTILPLKNYGCKYHTIRGGNRWKIGDKFSPRVWSGKPRHSKQIIIAPDIEIKKLWNVVIEFTPNQTHIMLPTKIHSQFQLLSLGDVAKNDGLSFQDFEGWFNPNKEHKTFEGQIICWNENINY